MEIKVSDKNWAASNACRLLSLNKKPEVSPIGVEVSCAVLFGSV